MTHYQQMIDTLKLAGLRITPQRVEICRLLAESQEHPTAQQIYEELVKRYPSISLATVYNTLDVLVQHGVINLLGEAGDNAVHYDADTSPHINLACLKCHKVIDFPSEHIHQVDHEVQTASGYRLLGARVMYYGLCPDCQSQVSHGGTSHDHEIHFA